MTPDSSISTGYPSIKFGILLLRSSVSLTTMTFKQGVLSSGSRPTKIPITPDMVSKSLSWSLRTALISLRVIYSCSPVWLAWLHVSAEDAMENRIMVKAEQGTSLYKCPKFICSRANCSYCPTIVAPKKLRTSPIGFATARVLLPAYKRPTALGLIETSSTIREPESPPARNLLPLLLIII